MLRDELHRLREEVLGIATRRGATNVRVFGSVARGEESASSDVDLLVRMARGRTLLDMSRLKQELEELLGRRVDVISEAALKPRIRGRVLAEARPL